MLAPAHFIRALAPAMLRRGHGRIATVSSIRGQDPLASPEVAAYSAAKAALENLTTTYARELAPTVTVNGVAPGLVLTDMADTWSDTVRREVDRSLLGRAALSACSGVLGTSQTLELTWCDAGADCRVSGCYALLRLQQPGGPAREIA